ncbi:MAG TPA: DUF4147 domain-containing protein [Pyrinomonadaceae bacterium]|nr:DUF4147 domain-containing protein [Pyrinomonadaceae bacterium]
MRNLTQLRLAAREIFEEALRAVDAGEAVRRAVQRREESFLINDVEFSNPKVYSIAVGKAARTMDYALGQMIGELLAFRILVGPDPPAGPAERVLLNKRLWYAGGHPLPNKRSLYAAQKTLEILEQADSEAALVIFLVSGGGSAIMEWPINDEISLGDLRMTNKALIASGASIGEINTVRRAFSAVKGGRLAARAPNCDQITLIISDVPAGQEWNVASGPTLSPPVDAPRARDVLEKYDLRSQIPEPVLSAIDAEPEPRPPENPTTLREQFVLLRNDDALEAAANAARRRGFNADIARDISDESIESGCERLIERISKPRQTIDADLSVISGGEFSCPVRGTGLGGRNLETALRLACSANLSLPDFNFVALCAGTDGIDGNSPAAGAIVDSTTLERARTIGLDAHDFLNRSDAYSFFVALGDAITTGATGTNVRDLRILLRSNKRKQIDT